MQTDDFIDRLVKDLAPVSPWIIERRIAVGVGLGVVVTVIVAMVWLGPRPDLMQAIYGFSFWMKGIFTFSLAGSALVDTIHFARPDSRWPRSLIFVLIPFLLMAGVATVELITTPARAWLEMWLGQSWRECSLRIVLLAIPIFFGLIWAFRRFAPTRLTQAGATIGFASGACAATIYGLSCPEVSATFVITWYSLGIGLATVCGALLSQRLLRW